MDFDNRAVQGHGLDLDPHDLLFLQLREHSIEHAALGPPIHPGVDGVPVPESLGQATPLAAVLRYVEDGIENCAIGETDVPPLRGEAIRNSLVLNFGDLHPRSLPTKFGLVLTRPSRFVPRRTPHGSRLHPLRRNWGTRRSLAVGQTSRYSKAARESAKEGAHLGVEHVDEHHNEVDAA
jgi:hypothetical protein